MRATLAHNRTSDAIVGATQISSRSPSGRRSDPMAGLKLVGVKAKPVLRLLSDLQIWRASEGMMATTASGPNGRHARNEGVTDKGRGAERATGNFSSDKEGVTLTWRLLVPPVNEVICANKSPRGRE